MEISLRNFVQAVDENENLKKISAVLLALCPILQHYKGIVFNLAINVMIALVPYFTVRLLGRIKDINLKKLSPVLIMLVFQVYLVINHGTSVKEVGESGVYIIYLVSIVMGCIDLKYFVKASSCIAMIACAGIMLQYVCFYIFGFHLQMVTTTFLLPSAEQWILNAQTGLANIKGVIGNTYRPSAFFLEPSHAYLYMFPHLALFMFNGKDKKESLYPSLFISAGLLLTTSGMGITAVRILWLMYFGMKDEENGNFYLKNMLRLRSFIKMVIFFVVSEVAIAYVPFLRDAVMRIFIPERDGGSTAISGRIRKAIEFLSTMEKGDILLGVKDYIHGLGFNVPGFFDIMYRHGIVGMILSYNIFIVGLINTKLPNGVVCLGVLGTSLFSIHTHATVYMMYFILIILSGYDPDKRSFLQ